MSPANRTAAQRLKRIAARARTLAVVYVIVLFVGTHIPPEQAEALAPANDKWMHYAAYTLLTVLVLTGWELTVGVLQPKHYFAVWLAGVLYGVFDEVSQTPVGRICDMNDLIADVLGVVCGLLVFRLGRAALYKAIALTSPVTSQK